MGVRRFDVYLVNLDPTIGAEIQKTRPCLVISPDELHRNIRTVDQQHLLKRLDHSSQVKQVAFLSRSAAPLLQRLILTR